MTNEKEPDNNRSRLKIGAVGVLTTLLYLWLPIRCFGGLAPFFRHPAGRLSRLPVS